VDNLAVPCLNLLPIRVVDTDCPILEVAKALMKDLQRRAGTLEQSKLRDVSRWAGLEGKPLCNVYVNVLHTGSGVDCNPVKERVFEPVKVSMCLSQRMDQNQPIYQLPYRVLESSNESSNQWRGAFSIPEVQVPGFTAENEAHY
jgi:hypothetical protein